MISVPMDTAAPDTLSDRLTHTLEGGPELVLFSEEFTTRI